MILFCVGYEYGFIKASFDFKYIKYINRNSVFIKLGTRKIYMILLLKWHQRESKRQKDKESYRREYIYVDSRNVKSIKESWMCFFSCIYFSHK